MSPPKAINPSTPDASQQANCTNGSFSEILKTSRKIPVRCRNHPYLMPEPVVGIVTKGLRVLHAK